MLSQLLEDHGPGRRIDAHGKRFRAEENPDQALAKQQLHNLFDNWQEACTYSQPGCGKLSMNLGDAVECVIAWIVETNMSGILYNQQFQDKKNEVKRAGWCWP